MDLGQYAFTLRIQVRDYEVDAEGIVNNAEYLHYMEHTRHEFCKEAGLSFRAMRQQGIDPVASHIEIDYKRSLGLGDEMISCLNIYREGPRFVFQQDIYHTDGTIASQGKVSIVSLVNGKLSRGDELAAAFAKYLQS